MRCPHVHTLRHRLSDSVSDIVCRLCLSVSVCLAWSLPVCPGPCLSGLYLTGLYLTGLYLTGLYLTGLVITGLVITGLNLTGLILNRS